jgi:N-acetyl-anhydromuramyl-L-alanine amidase AmpD
MNCRSVAICFDSNLEDRSPSEKALAAAKRILVSRYPQVSASEIYGHREINPNTTCPGEGFVKAWKRKLVAG